MQKALFKKKKKMWLLWGQLLAASKPLDEVAETDNGCVELVCAL